MSLTTFQTEYDDFFVTSPNFTGYKLENVSFCKKMIHEVTGRLGMFVLGATGIARSLIITVTSTLNFVISGVISFDKLEFTKAKLAIYEGAKRLAFYIIVATSGVILPKETSEILDDLRSRGGYKSELLKYEGSQKQSYNCINTRIIVVTRTLMCAIDYFTDGLTGLIEFPFTRYNFKACLELITIDQVSNIFIGLKALCDKKTREIEFNLK